MSRPRVDPALLGEPVRDVLGVDARTLAAACSHAERERAASALYRVALEGTWVIDAGFRTVAVSQSVAGLLGRPADELVGRPCDEWVLPEDRAALRAALARRRTGVRETYEIRWVRPDGDHVCALMAATPLLDDAGAFAGSLSLVTDVTERRRTAERLARHAREQEAIAALGRLALEGAELPDVLDAALRAIAGTLGADVVGAFRAGGDGRLQLVAAHGMTATPHDAEAVAPDGVAGALGVDAAVCAPVAGRDEHGVLAVGRRGAWAPGAEERRFVETVALVVASAIERVAAERDARRRGLLDSLTGLPGRSLVLDRLDQALRRAARRTTGVTAVAVVDLDRFRAVNEALGTEAGDAVLCQVGPRLREALRPADTVGRLAGDGFVVLCEDLPDDASAAAVAERVVEAIRGPFDGSGEDVALTASVGVAVSARGGRMAAELLRDAGTAVDRAKAAGRDRFELFDEALRQRSLERIALGRDLRRAAERGELFVAYQPIARLDDGRLTGVEALVRWRHPERGVVSPGEFIPLAEEQGLIGAIGGYVLRAACEEVARHAVAGRPLTCHVNLSAHQVHDPDLPATVQAVLERTGIPPESLVLEITESSVIAAGDGPLGVLHALRALGVRLVLDDFGTGYSSLSRLRHLPIDGLKVDRSFVADLDGGPGGEGAPGWLLVAGIVEMARALTLTVVAEGVETPAQLDRLRAIGCRYAQGFLLARPGDPDRLAELVAAGRVALAA